MLRTSTNNVKILDIGCFSIYKEKPGVISKDSIWVILDEYGYMYTHDTLIGVLWVFLSQFRSDSHMIG